MSLFDEIYLAASIERTACHSILDLHLEKYLQGELCIVTLGLYSLRVTFFTINGDYHNWNIYLHQIQC